jgi:DNA-binding IclR family transcriptional regulator
MQTKNGTKKSVEPQSNLPDRYYSRAIANALRILELFWKTDEPLALTEVARQVRLPKSSAFRILRTLEIDGYLQRHQGERFSIVPDAGFVQNRTVKRVMDASKDWMKKLSQEFHETISLACLFENHIEVTAVIDSRQRVSMGNSVGSLIPPHASSLGKCIVAFQPDARRETLLQAFGLVRFTLNTITDEALLNKELNLVRSQGYASDLEETALGGCCIGAPIFDRDGNAVAAISISSPKMRFANQDRLTAAVKDAAAAITAEMRTS